MVPLFPFNAGQPTTNLKADGVVKSPSFSFSTQLSPVTTESGPFAKGSMVQPFLFKKSEPLPGAQAAKPSPHALHSQPMFSLGLPKKEVATNQSNASPEERPSESPFWNQGQLALKPVFQIGVSSQKEPLTGANRRAKSQSPFKTSTLLTGNPRPVTSHQGAGPVPSTLAAVPVFSEKKEPSLSVNVSKLMPVTSAQRLPVGPGKMALSTALASAGSTYSSANSQFPFKPQKSLGLQLVSTNTAKDLGGGLVQAVIPTITTTADATQTPKLPFPPTFGSQPQMKLY